MQHRASSWQWQVRAEAVKSPDLEVTRKHMDVSKNKGTPKWMVKIMENPIKMDDLGVPLFLETPISHILLLLECWTRHTPQQEITKVSHTSSHKVRINMCVYRKVDIYKTFRLSLISRWWFQQIFSFHPYLGKIPILTNIFQIDWNHQTDIFFTLLLSFQWYCVFFHWGHIVLGDQHLDYLLLV